ncbi:hypothetical protein HanRHA438_Chr11g0514251 [Helianthus annuus]|nr:hypothetical protein HanIR_Chr11g0540041 [Helianthus annuus]KAJ0871591.1 hypothetical protein HanRHA438_Chr11g0514251 [Helianthus annuus]
MILIAVGLLPLWRSWKKKWRCVVFSTLIIDEAFETSSEYAPLERCKRDEESMK